MRIEVLDNGYVSLIESWGSDERIVESARMSTGKGFTGWGQGASPGDERLLGFLWRNRHTSPFEQCGLTVEVQAPIMVFREWHRHRTQSYNEFSGRYAQMPDIHYLPELSRIKRQSSSNKQGTSSEEIPLDVAAEFLNRLADEQRRIYETYAWAVSQGIAKEVARINTPISRYSKMRATANLLNWLRFLGLRTPATAQWEIRQYAEAVSAIVKQQFPRTWALFRDHPL